MYIQNFNENGKKNKAVQAKYSLFKGSEMDFKLSKYPIKQQTYKCRLNFSGFLFIHFYILKCSAIDICIYNFASLTLQ